MAPARTGRDSRSRIVVIKIDQTKRGAWSMDIPGLRIFRTVEIKLMAPKMEEAPARCNEKIAKSTALPLCAELPAKGG